MQRNQWAAAAFAALLFLGGAAAGALGHRYYVGSPVIASSDNAHHRYVQEMQDRLKLTPDQVSKLEAIMHDTRTKTRAVRQTIEPQMLQIKQDHIERVKAILTPQQVPEYQKLVAEREQRSREQEEHDRNSTR